MNRINSEWWTVESDSRSYFESSHGQLTRYEFRRCDILHVKSGVTSSDYPWSSVVEDMVYSSSK